MNSATLSHLRLIVATAIAISLIVSLPSSAFLIGEAATQATHEVKITGFAFVPQNLTINPGSTVIWNNSDPVIHTLWFVHVSNRSTYLLSDPILPNSTWSYMFHDPVELQYYDFDRLWITGFLTVQSEVHDVAIINVVLWKTVVGQGYDAKIDVAVKNEGEFAESFAVTLNASSTVIGILAVNNLLKGTSRVLTFTWNTTGFSKGNYTISAYVAPVPSEADIADNTFFDGMVRVVKAGDFGTIAGGYYAFDDLCDYQDLFLFRKAYTVAYHELCDFDNDHDVDYLDLFQFRKCYIKP